MADVQLKVSRFNVLVNGNNGNRLVYNTLNGSITRVSPSLAELIGRRDAPRLCSPELAALAPSLRNAGILVERNIDELREYEKLHARWKEGRESVEFNVLLTYDCNFECPYCYQGRGEEGQRLHGFASMPPEVLEPTKQLMKRTAIERGAKTLELVLYGGEPFLMPEICRDLTNEMAAWAANNGISFKLQALSNGSLITEQSIEWLSAHKCRLQIPVDGDPAMHNKYRYDKDTREGSFGKVADVLAMTRGTDIETHIRISLTDETYPTMEGLLDELKQRGLSHVFPDFCYITAFTDACSDFVGHTLSDLKLFKIIPELWKKAHERGFPLDIRPRVQPLPCSSIAEGSFIIDPFGDVFKCWEHVGLKEHAVGKLKKDGTLQKTKVYDDVLKRNPTKIDACKDHSFLPACGGGCVCKAQWEHKTYHAPGCGSEKYLLKDKVAMYTLTLEPITAPLIARNGFELQPIEGRQDPKMSHCYVLV